MAKTEIKNIIDSIHANRASDIIKVLQAVQARFGYLQYEQVQEIAQLLNMPESKVYGIATYYTQFRFQPKAKYHIKICNGTSCHIKDQHYLIEELTRWIKTMHSSKKNHICSLEIVTCLGVCAHSPAMAVNDAIYTKLDTAKLRKILSMIENNSLELDLELK
jgi:NADH-quinone oxidoreductase subunit E